MEIDLIPLAKAYETRRAEFNEIDRKHDELSKRICDAEDGPASFYSQEEYSRVWNEWRAAYDALEDAHLTFQEQAAKAAGIREDHLIVVRIKRRREELTKRRRTS